MMPESLPIIARDYDTSFRRERDGRRLAAEFRQEIRFFCLRRNEMARLHMAEAADLFRDAGQRHGDCMLLRRKSVKDFLDHRLIVRNELAFGAALFAVAENVERRAAQELEARQQSKCLEHPWTE